MAFEQQNFQQPYGMGMGMPNMMGQQQPTNYRVSNTLSPDEIKLLKKNSTTFSLGLSQEELLRAVCNHRSEDGLSDALQVDPVTGIAKCTICGYEFRPLEPDFDPEELKESIKRVEDIIQTSKLMYLDLPVDAAREYYPILGLLEKLPQFIEFAAKDMARHDNWGYNQNNNNISPASMYQNLASMLAGMTMNGGIPQPQQNVFYNQPAGYPQGVYPQPTYPQPSANPFGYVGMPQPQAPVYNPGTPANFVYQPGVAPTAAPTAPTTPVAPQAAPAADATVSQTVTV